MNRILTAPLSVSISLLMLSLTSTSGFAQLAPGGSNPTITSPEPSSEEIQRLWPIIRRGLPDPVPTHPGNTTVIINRPTRSVPQPRSCDPYLSNSQVGNAAAMGVKTSGISNLPPGC